MARRRISVDKIKEVIRYGVTTELSERAIGRALKVSRTAVTKYLECFRGSGLTWEQAQELPDSELLAVLEGSRPARTSARYERLAERFPMMVKELRRKGVTLQLLWEEYLRAHPDGYQNSQFCYHFHRWRKSAEVSMHIDHKAGEKLFVDYAGDRLAIVDPDSGKEQPVETFVAILGASELTYVEASATQQGDDWIRSNERALRYCGGGTQVIVPDNLRSAVSRSDPYEPGINATFDAFAQHYGVVIMPARVRQARDKALVENAVRLTYQRIYAPLRDRAFHSLDELNAAIRPLLEQHNGRRFQRLPYSRRELFEQIERHTLAPLPQHHFPLQQTREVTVQFNYHIELREDRHHYSVPWQLRTRDPRTKVKLLYDERTVSIYYDNVRLAEYQRDRRPGDYTTLPDHMPPQHRWYAEWSPERFVRWGRALGANVEAVIEQVLKDAKYPPQGFRSCLGILSLEKSYGAARLDRACRRALSYRLCSYRRIQNMLKLGLEEEQEQQPLSFPSHDNVRGSHYYN